MKKTFEQLMQESRNLSLSREEKLRIRDRIVHVMQMRPVRTIEADRQTYHWSEFPTFKQFINPMPIALILTILLGGSFSYAAEGALPGETLYPVKVGVNEKVRAIFAVSEEAKAGLDTRLAARRLEEAAELAAQGRLNAETRADIESRFEEFAERANDRIARLEEKDESEAAAEVNSQFETSLLVHERILARLSNGDDRKKGMSAPAAAAFAIHADVETATTASKRVPEEQTEISDETALGISAEVKTEVKPILSKVRARIKAVTENRLKAETRMRTRSNVEIHTSAEGKAKAAQNKIDETRRYILRSGTAFNADAQARAEARLKAAEEAYAEGTVKLQAEAYGDAFALFQQALRIAQEAKLLLEARERLNIDFGVELPATGRGTEDSDEEEARDDNSGDSADDRSNTNRDEDGSNSEPNEAEVEIEHGTEVEIKNNEIKTEDEIRLRLGL